MLSRRLMMVSAIALMATAGNARPTFQPIELQLLKGEHPTHLLEDRLVDLEDGSRYRLFRAIPKTAPPDAGWPVLWLTDGNAFFDRIPPALLAEFPELVVIGIGYDTDLPFHSVNRALDYTPPPLRPDPKRAERMVGGADSFLARIKGPLRERAEGDLKIDESRRTLAGHSYGGLFAIYARGHDSGFTRFAAASPSLWLDPGLPAAGDLPLTIFVGDQERERGETIDPTNPAFQVPRQTQSFVERAHLAGQQVDLVILPGLQHGETLVGALPDFFSIANA